MSNHAAADYTDEQISVSGPTTLDTVDAKSFNAAGHTTVDGDVRADTVDVSGAIDVHGDLRATHVTTHGSTDIRGEVTAETLDVNGATHVQGTVSAVIIEASGAVDVDEHVACEELDASGSTALTTLAAEEVHATGATDVGEMIVDTLDASGATDIDALDASDVHLTLGNADATITTITADDVTVTREPSPGGLVGVLTGRSIGHLTVDRLEADTVTLTETTVTDLDVRYAEIGPGCRVDTLTATDWTIDDDATVDQTVHRDDAE